MKSGHYFRVALQRPASSDDSSKPLSLRGVCFKGQKIPPDSAYLEGLNDRE